MLGEQSSRVVGAAHRQLERRPGARRQVEVLLELAVLGPVPGLALELDVLPLVVPLAVGGLAPQTVVQYPGNDCRLIVGIDHHQRSIRRELSLHLAQVVEGLAPDGFFLLVQVRPNVAAVVDFDVIRRRGNSCEHQFASDADDLERRRQRSLGKSGTIKWHHDTGGS